MNDYLTALTQVWTGPFWAAWVMIIVALNYCTMLFLLLWAPGAKIPVEDDGTTGHVWSGGAIKESLHRLPKWWLILSTLSFIVAFGYLVRYPGFGTEYKGTANWTSHDQTMEQLADLDNKKADLWKTIEDTPILELSDNPRAMHLGLRLFQDNCAACHGYDAKGNHLIGAPNLTDNTWLYGGAVKDVVASITNGRSGVMPPWKGTLDTKQIHDVANYVRGLSGQDHDDAAADRGEETFAKICSACHGADGTGNQALGAPNLTDDIWKYDGSLDGIIHSIAHGRHGHMPTWSKRLDDKHIRVLAAWVLSHDNQKEALAAKE